VPVASRLATPNVRRAGRLIISIACWTTRRVTKVRFPPDAFRRDARCKAVCGYLHDSGHVGASLGKDALKQAIAGGNRSIKLPLDHFVYCGAAKDQLDSMYGVVPFTVYGIPKFAMGGAIRRSILKAMTHVAVEIDGDAVLLFLITDHESKDVTKFEDEVKVGVFRRSSDFDERSSKKKRINRETVASEKSKLVCNLFKKPLEQIAKVVLSLRDPSDVLYSNAIRSKRS
jgi:hypothetical protein